jgi:hypothetical protein
MGDRALIQFTSKDEVSPVLYLHWSGANVPTIIRKAHELMAGRRGDVSYSFARMVSVACAENPGNLSVGVWNCAKTLTAEDTHGDAGCIVVDVTGGVWNVRCFGGYLAARDVVL